MKTKRGSLRRIIERTKSKFNVGVAEVAEQDTWQRGTVGLVVVGNAEPHVQSMLDGILSFVEQLYLGQVLDVERELLHYSDQERLDGFSGDGYTGGERAGDERAGDERAGDERAGDDDYVGGDDCAGHWEADR